MNWLEDKKILIADDDEYSWEIARIFLESLWIKKENIFVVENWNKAIELTKKEIFDLILMDISMPGLDWIETSKKIKAKYNGNSPKIIAYTANQYLKRDNGIEIMDDIMIKPIEIETFKKQILDVLN